MADIKIDSDSGKFKAGADQDLEVYNDGSHSYISGVTASQNMVFATRPSGGSTTTAVTIESDGTVSTTGAFQPAGNVTCGADLTVNGGDVTISNSGGHAYLNIDSHSNEASDSAIAFRSGTTERGYIYYDHNTTAASQKMVFNVGDNAVTAMTILGDGNVGIGLSPSYALDILNSTTPQLNLSNTASDDTVKFSHMTTSHYHNSEEPMTMIEGRSDGSQNYLRLGGGRQEGNSMTILEVYFGSNDAHIAGVKKMSFDESNGYFLQNIGIGTASPIEALHVDGQAIIDDANTLATNAVPTTLFINSQNDSTLGFATKGNGAGCNTIIGIDDSDGDKFKITNHATDIGGADHFVLSGGKVGIGNTGPAHTFTVEDSVNAYTASFKNNRNPSSSAPYGVMIRFHETPDNGTSEFLRCDDSVGSSAVVRCIISSEGDLTNHDNSYGATSDKRIKQGIKDANSQWDDIKAVKVRNFKKNDDVAQYGDKAWEQIGVIAQELEEAGMDKLVREHPANESEVVVNDDINEGDMVKTVSYSVLYMKAIKALQEAMTKIETLETKVEALENA